MDELWHVLIEWVSNYLAKITAYNPNVYSPITISLNEMRLLLLVDVGETLFSR
jgi:hypothetical protein